MCLGSLGTVTRTWDEGGVPMAEVDASGRTFPACLLYHPDTSAGQGVLVHMGFVVEVLDEDAMADAMGLRTDETGRWVP